jgi:signal transduction histidine kinase
VGTRTCFVISPFGDETSASRKRSDQVIRHVIEPVVVDAGYDVERADRLGKPGIITSQVIERLVQADLVVADLSEHNANVFYELAVRHAARKPLIQLISREFALPFDVAGMRTIFYDLADPDENDRAKKEIRDHLDAIETDSDAIDTPISAALDLAEMRASGELVPRTLAEIRQAIADLRTEVQLAQSAWRPPASANVFPGVEASDWLSTPIINSSGEVSWGRPATSLGVTGSTIPSAYYSGVPSGYYSGAPARLSPAQIAAMRIPAPAQAQEPWMDATASSPAEKDPEAEDVASAED